MIEINRRQKNDARTSKQAHVLYPLLYLTEEKVQEESFSNDSLAGTATVSRLRT